MRINITYNENCLDTMAKMPAGFIDLTITSPPYDNLRHYHGYSFDFHGIARELFRVTKKGGVVVWIANDATIKGSETGTSFRQALYFMEIGFNLHDTMIWERHTPFHDVNSAMRYRPGFDFMFVLSKNKPATFNPILDVENKKQAPYLYVAGNRRNDGRIRTDTRDKIIPSKTRCRENIWRISNTGNKTPHPAVFPEKLANDHIISWSDNGDLIYDPFMGSGTTAKMAIANNRNFIGSEISSKYCDIIDDRIRSIK